MPLLVSSTLAPTLTTWINRLLATLVTTPGGNTPVTLGATTGGLSFQETDCTAWSLAVSAPGPSGSLAQVGLTFPGSSVNLTGFVDPTLLGALVTPNAVQAANTAPLAGTNVALTGPSITRASSGKVLVAASLSADTSPQSAVAVSLYRDGVTLLAHGTASPGAAGANDVAVSLHWLDTLPDNGPHYYTIGATSAGALTAAVGAAVVTAVEL